MVVLKGARAGAQEFYAFLQGAAARQVFERHGFAAG
jgi:ABC-type molybdate transport system substrate-binding protein